MNKLPLAYHAVVHALEAKSGWSGRHRFAAAVAHAIDGHLPYARYHAAGRKCAREGMGQGHIERLVRDFLETDINPAVAFIAALWHPASALAAYNAYNACANLGVRTIVAVGDATRPGGDQLAARRSAQTGEDDPAPCRTATLSVMGEMLVHVGAGGGMLHRPASLTQLADFLGCGHGAGADVARVLEDDGLVPFSALPGRLGCQRRTLERRLREEQLSLGVLRQASRLMRATAGLFSGATVTEIALDCGFADAAHLNRAFRQAAGIPPGMLIRIARADAGREQSLPRLPYRPAHQRG